MGHKGVRTCVFVIQTNSKACLVDSKSISSNVVKFSHYLESKHFYLLTFLIHFSTNSLSFLYIPF